MAQILVGHKSKHKALARGIHGIDLTHYLLPAADVMSGIGYGEGALPYPAPAAEQMGQSGDIGKTIADSFVRYLPPEPAQR